MIWARNSWLLALCLLVGCGPQTTPISETRTNTLGHPQYTLTTMKHDGHLFVVCTSGDQGVAIILHPDDGKPVTLPKAEKE